ncbi:MAG: MFS transporter [Chloroflexota bacterium]|nr:MFS transporter [Dehalococcoidia bacterium]MDW8254901.1 MFS transporter [Chloroflexota bacterium]
MNQALRQTRPAVIFIVLLGIVSLLADMTYEGARGIVGAYLGQLGATAVAVGLVAGLAELLGYVLRLVFGLLTDRLRRPWDLVILGYVVNLGAVPLLALAGRWEAAVVLVIAERVGKAIRTPGRDAMLAHASATTGHGWGFGLHEALDQIGAVLGPLLVAAIVAARGEMRPALAALAIPAALALAVLLFARLRYPNPSHLGLAAALPETTGFSRRYWIYLGGAALFAAGFVDFALVAYHVDRAAIADPSVIALFYALAMGVDAAAALLCGMLFDRIGFAVVPLSAAVSAIAAPLLFLGGGELVLLGVALWGFGLGAQESVLRAGIAALAPPSRRGAAYGTFSALFGIAWFAGSALFGLLYGASIVALVAASIGLQLAATAVLTLAARANGTPSAPAAG